MSSTRDSVEVEASAGEPQPRVDAGLVYRFLMICGVLPAGHLGFGVRVRGREHLPERGGLLIAANHQSYLDIPAIAFGAWRRHVAFVARDTLAGSRLLAWIMHYCGAILIRRGSGDLSAIRGMAAMMRAGDLVSVFPEGTRTPNGKLGEFKKGAHLAARKAGVPILPCAIRGTFEAWPRQRRLPRLRRVEVEFGPAVDSSASDALDQVRAHIERLLAPPTQTTATPKGRG
jgi:1-acyl-sn-glycerol-3-phosphate acyltransferase